MKALDDKALAVVNTLHHLHERLWLGRGRRRLAGGAGDGGETGGGGTGTALTRLGPGKVIEGSAGIQ